MMQPSRPIDSSVAHAVVQSVSCVYRCARINCAVLKQFFENRAIIAHVELQLAGVTGEAVYTGRTTHLLQQAGILVKGVDIDILHKTDIFR
jgi:hypothetical protein